MSEQHTSLTVTAHAGTLAMPDNHWSRIKELATTSFKSGLLPKAIDNEQKALVIALKGYAMNLDPMFALDRMYVIGNKACVDGQGMLAIVYSRCPGAQINFLTPADDQAKECTLEMIRPGKKPQTFKFTMEDAKRAGLLNNPSWTKYPKAMLRWRAVAEGARIVFPDLISGLYLPEEMGAVVDEDGAVIDAEFTVSTGANSKNVEQRPAAPAAAKPSAETAAVPPVALTEQDLATLRAARLEHNWTADDVKTWTLTQYKKDPTEISHEQCLEVIAFIESHPGSGKKR